MVTNFGKEDFVGFFCLFVLILWTRYQIEQ